MGLSDPLNGAVSKCLLQADCGMCSVYTHTYVHLFLLFAALLAEINSTFSWVRPQGIAYVHGCSFVANLMM